MEGDEGFTSAEVDVMQLVSGRGEMRAEVAQQLQEALVARGGAESDDAEVCCIAAVGAKGSGKSTLLNELFDASFELGVRCGPRAAASGTHGVWASVVEPGVVDVGRPLLVLDLESQEASAAPSSAASGSAGSRNPSQCVSFTLALADVIFFNVYASDLGRYDAAGYALLRTMLSEFCRIFPRDDGRRTALVFVVRDHDDGSSVQTLQRMVEDDMTSLWKSVSKSDAYQDSGFDVLFELTLVTLPHIRYRSTEFRAGIDALRQRLSGQTSALLKPEFCKAVPVHALATYAEVVWNDLSDEQVASLPSQRELVAAYRCDAVFSEQHKKLRGRFGHWYSDTEKGCFLGGLGKDVDRLLRRVSRDYADGTSLFSQWPVRAEQQTRLSTFVQHNFRTLFNKQLLLLQNQTLKRFKNQLSQRISVNGAVAPSDQDTLIKGMDSWFTRRASGLVAEAFPELTFYTARLEVEAVLREFAVKFNDSPTVQLQALTRIQREASKPVKERKLGLSLVLNGVMRPRGYGNLQFVSNYLRNGHRANLVAYCKTDSVRLISARGFQASFRVQCERQTIRQRGDAAGLAATASCLGARLARHAYSRKRGPVRSFAQVFGTDAPA
ncbi:Protein ROOT HAIR DEFECTIVE 3-like 1 [Porphyridium purpureum]|uniref:Protein ROOT HAIR DEFECTIVE 3-like 1 n=1 Tax=Porphyridium purpureum TaxID=35688 RepID=A0A5J4Z599_PORPP|nr:Protein ROOT HAIR DEFECTIVE 3-like 1 [Porphyridium purpureum]|eukprot:POR0439..scf295_1